MSFLTPILIAVAVIVASIACSGFLLARQLARRNELREYEEATSSLADKASHR